MARLQYSLMLLCDEPTGPTLPFTLSTIAEGQLFNDVLPWLLLLTGLVIIGGIFIYAARRLLYGSTPSSSEGFTLQTLRDLHKSDKLTDEEFERARAAMIGQVRQTAEADSKLHESSDESVHSSNPTQNDGHTLDGTDNRPRADLE